MKYGYISIEKGNTQINFYLSGHYHAGNYWIDFPEIGYNGYTVKQALNKYKRAYMHYFHNVSINDYRRI